MTPKPPKPIWVNVYDDGAVGAYTYVSHRDAKLYASPGARVTRYIPAPTKRRKKPRKSGGPQ